MRDVFLLLLCLYPLSILVKFKVHILYLNISQSDFLSAQTNDTFQVLFTWLQSLVWWDTITFLFSITHWMVTLLRIPFRWCKWHNWLVFYHGNNWTQMSRQTVNKIFLLHNWKKRKFKNIGYGNFHLNFIGVQIHTHFIHWHFSILYSK